MATLHDLMTGSIDGRTQQLADASAVEATRALIGRRRLRNAAVAGGTSALAIGGLLAAGLMQTRRADGNDPATADPNGIGYVDVDLSGSDAWPGFTDPVTSVSCGDTVPAPVTRDQDFTQSVAVDPAAPDGTLRVSATLRYDGPNRAPAVINPGTAVLTRDGVVMDYYLGNGPATPFGAVTSGETWEANRVVDGSVFKQRPCSSGAYVESSPNDVAYPAGDYQVYVVSQALVSAPVLAERELQDQGYYVAAGASGVWNPGSIDCQQAITSAGGGITPVQCLDPLPSGVTIDEEAGTATLPYHSANYSGELNVTLISRPITVTLDHDVTYADLGDSSGPSSEPEPANLQPLVCGADANRGGSVLQANFAQIPSFADVVSGIDVPILVDMTVGAEKSRGTLHIGEDATAALIVGGGWITRTATPIVTPTEAQIDRAKGYPDVSVSLKDVTECPEPTEGTAALVNHDPSLGWVLEIRGQFRVDWEDGTTTTADWITLSGVEQG